MRNITKNNKMIAEFMGGKLSAHSQNLINMPQTIGEAKIHCVKGSEGLPNGTYSLCYLHELKYHSSWDWLMPVVEKINNTTDEFGNEMNFQIGNGFVWVDQPIGDRIYFSGNEIDHKKEPMIDKVYKAVVEFIQWYNQKN